MSSYEFDTQTNVSLREKVAIDIRNAILKGNLKPGHRIKEIEISKQMGVSRGPVREAIRQLEKEGLVISQPYRETIVADISSEEVRDILIPIRFHLEWFVINKYYQSMDHNFYQKLQAIADKMFKSSQIDDLEQLVELDILFHETIIKFAQERMISITWNSIVNQIKLHFIKNIQFFKRENLSSDHQLLIERLRSKDLTLIQKAFIHHLKGEESFLWLLNNTEDKEQHPSD